MLANNPAALALHEARLLFPNAPIACLASFGTGRFLPMERAGAQRGSVSHTVQTLVGAATRTEEVHQLLSDMLPVLSVPYFRFNPQVPRISLDETAAPKLRELQAIGREHVASGVGRDECVALAQLLQSRAPPAGASQRWPAKLVGVLSRLYARGRRHSRL